DRVVHPLHDLLARQPILIFPRQDLGITHEDSQKRRGSTVGGVERPRAHPLHVLQHVLESLSRPLGIDAMRFAARLAILTEATRAVVVPVLNDVRERARTLGAPLEAVDVVAPEQVFDRRVPERPVLGMIPAAGRGRLSVDVYRYDLREILDAA